MNNLVQAYHDYLSGKSLKDLSLILSDEEFSQLKQMIRNNDYWGDRLASATHQALNQGMTESEQVFKLYDNLANQLSTELLQLYSKIDAQKALGEVQISDFYRSGQLQNILDTIRKECQKIGQYENKTLNQLLPDAVNKGYEIAGDTFDIKLGHLNKKAVQAIVKDPWTEKSFSDRVWQSKSNLIDRLNNDLTTGLATGKSPYKIASELSKSLNVSKHASQRLVITEYMNKLNMGQQKAYEEAGYEEVRWHAVEDERKCSICGKLHDTRFKINEAPHAPIHPRCRCILLPVIDEVEEESPLLIDLGTELHAGSFYVEDIGRRKGKYTREIKEAIHSTNYNKLFGNEAGKALADAVNKMPEPVQPLFIDLIPSISFKLANGIPQALHSAIELNDMAIKGYKKNSKNGEMRKPILGVIHELGHSLDESKGWISCHNDLKENILGDIDNLLDHMDEEELIEQIKSYSIPRNIATNTISDVLGSSNKVTKNRPIFYGHNKSYWQIPGQQEKEFFAHYCSLLAFRDEFDLFTKLFPKASKICDNIIEEIIRGM